MRRRGAERYATRAANSDVSSAPAAPLVYEVSSAPVTPALPDVPTAPVVFAVPPGTSANYQDPEYLTDEEVKRFMLKLTSRIYSKFGEFAGGAFEGPVLILLAALQGLLEDARGSMSTVNPAAVLPAFKRFRIFLDALSFEIVASRELQSCRMACRVLNQTLDHYGLRQKLLTDPFDPKLVSQPALAL
jgi:hypothetical protein